MFVTFEGIDGAGKTTLAAEVVGALRSAGRDVEHVVKKSHFGDAFVQRHTEMLKTLLWSFRSGDPLHALGDRHWLHLQASWFALIEECRVKPALARGAIVVADNWFYKLIARYRLKSGSKQQEAEACFAPFLQPDRVVLLDVSPEVAVARKKTLSPAECGMFDGEARVGSAEFVRYQTRVLEEMRRMAERRSWVTLATGGESSIGNESSTGDATPAELAAACIRRLELAAR